MTVREAFETILDGSYDSEIKGVIYPVSEKIPVEYLDMEFKKVRPKSGKYEGYYKFYF